ASPNRFLPTTKNRQRWNVEKGIRRSLRQVIHVREKTAEIEKSSRYGIDLLDLLMSENKEQVGGNLKNIASLTVEEVIDECKTVLPCRSRNKISPLDMDHNIVGYTSRLARAMIAERCWKCSGKNSYLDADNLSHLKIVGMILNETLRLYPPAVFPQRQTYKPMKLGRLSIPAGIQLMLPILAIHHDPTLWGHDAEDFNPERFCE
ncbi:hypothetical protein KI387_035714, partial [Taxus chinensis]